MKLTKAIRQATIDEQLWRIEHHRSHLHEIHKMLRTMNKRAADVGEEINEAKRSLYGLGYKEPI